MLISAEQIRESQASYQLFKMAVGESFAPYCTPQVEDFNLTALCTWGTDNLPNGFESFAQIGAFQLAFQECLKAGILQRDPNWFSRAERKSLFVKFNNTLPAEKAKILYFGQLSAYNGLLTEEENTQLIKIGGEAAFKFFMDSEA